jgi:DNA-directed RNA polymerase specialized sigma24 family protein
MNEDFQGLSGDELVWPCLVEEPGAWDEMDGRTRCFLERWVRRMLSYYGCKDAHRVEDIVQEVWMSSASGPVGVLRLFDPSQCSLHVFLVKRAKAKVWPLIRSERRRRDREKEVAHQEADTGTCREQEARDNFGHWLENQSPALKEFGGHCLREEEAKGRAE